MGWLPRCRLLASPAQPYPPHPNADLLPPPPPSTSHAGAPNVGGAWATEAYSQAWLVLESLRMATDMLAPKGTFVTKVFR